MSKSSSQNKSNSPSHSVAVVTGSRKGLGRFLAEHFLAQGMTVYGCSRQDSDLQHESYRHICADVADESAVRGLFRQVRKEQGRLDILVNNAGIAAMNHVMLTPADSAQRMMQTNLQGTFLCCREATKVMQPAGYGRIVNMVTVAVPLKLDGEAMYAATKSAVLTFTQVLAREVGPMGITANAIGPTPVDTDLIRGVPAEKIDALVARQAIQRKGRPEDVAHVVDFFVDPASEFVTGQVIYLGGVS